MTHADEVLADPSVSFWLKAAIKACLDRDPVDALADAELLVRVLKSNLNHIKGLE